MLPNGFLNIAQGYLLQPKESNIQHEVECRFRSYDASIRGGVPFDVYNSFVKYMQQNAKFVRTNYVDYMQNIKNPANKLVKSTLRVQIINIENQQPYVTKQVKQPIYRDSSPNYPLLFTVSQEETISDNDSRLRNFLVQTIRVKDRMSFKFKNFNIDLTKTQEYKPKLGAFRFTDDIIYNGLTDTELDDKGVTYEVEMEINKLEGLEAITLQQYLAGYMKIMWQTNLVYSKTEYQNVVNYYNRVLGSSPERQNNIEHASKITKHDSTTFNSKYLYKPRNLKLQDMVYGGVVGNESNNYIVSYKADGERRLLIIDSNGLWLVAPPSKANLIVRTDRLTTSDVNLYQVIQGTILEGELVPISKQRATLPHSPKYIFYCYDTLAEPLAPGGGSYFVSTNVQGKDYITRWKSAQEIANQLQNYNEDLVNIYHTSAIPLWVGTKSIRQTTLYDIYPNPTQFFMVMEEMLLARDTVPYEQDGLIFTPSDTPYNQRTDQKYKLYDRVLTKHPDICKWKPVEEMTIDLMILDDKVYAGYKDKNKDQDEYKKTNDIKYLRKFQESIIHSGRYYLPFTGSEWYPFSGEIDWQSLGEYQQQDGAVLEFMINTDDNSLKVYRWREDKLFPNDIIFAVDSWDWAHNPIKESTLMGKDTVLMRRYHNRIKRTMFNTCFSQTSNNRGKTLLDIGSGRGGDVEKWKHGGFTKIVAVEPDADNKVELERRIDAAGMSDMVRVVKTGGEDTGIITSEVTQFLGGPADVVSMMLSLSFFWRDQKRLKGLLQTIVNNIKPDGKFIFMTIDGVSVEEYFRPQLKPGTNIYTIDTDVYTLSLDYPTNSTDKPQVYINIKDSVTALDQKEWLVFMNDITLGLYTILFTPDNFNRADKEKFLNPSELILTKLYTYGSYNLQNDDLVKYKPWYDIESQQAASGNGEIEILPGITAKSDSDGPSYLPDPKLKSLVAATPIQSITTQSLPVPASTTQPLPLQPASTTQSLPVPASTTQPLPLQASKPIQTFDQFLGEFNNLSIQPATQVINQITPSAILPAIPDDSVVNVINNWYSDIVRIGCIADGNCFAHAILKATNKNYAASPINRLAMARMMRRDVAYLLSQTVESIAVLDPSLSFLTTIYDKPKEILYVQYPQFLQYYIFTYNQPDISSMYSLPGMMRLINSTQFLGEEVFIIFADLLNINLYITVAKTNNLVYLNNYIRPSRQWNIVISGNTQHYELIGVRRQNDLVSQKHEIQTVFENNDPFIQALQNKPK